MLLVLFYFFYIVNTCTSKSSGGLGREKTEELTFKKCLYLDIYFYL